METFLTGGSSGLFCSGVRWEGVGFHVLPFRPSGGPGQRGARPPARGRGAGGVCKKPRYHGRCDKWQRFAKSSEGCGRPPGATDLPGRDPHPSFGGSALESLIAPAKGIFILFYILCLMSCKAQRYLTRGQLGSGGRVPTRAPGAPGATFALPWRGPCRGCRGGRAGEPPGCRTGRRPWRGELLFSVEGNWFGAKRGFKPLYGRIKSLCPGFHSRCLRFPFRFDFFLHLFGPLSPLRGACQALSLLWVVPAAGLRGGAGAAAPCRSLGRAMRCLRGAPSLAPPLSCLAFSRLPY